MLLDVIVVDDNESRYDMLIAFLQQKQFYKLLSIDCCKTADQARIKTKIKIYDLMILDAVLPKKMGYDPSFSVGLELLNDLQNGQLGHSAALRAPKRIIGITANSQDLHDFSEKFIEHTTVIIDANIGSSAWLDKISANIETMLAALNYNKDKLLITIHGIRTFGQWQKKLQELLCTKTLTFDFSTIKYGFFQLFIMYIPFLRDMAIVEAKKTLIDLINNSQEKKIYIVAHSFGTYIAAKAIISSQCIKNVEMVIFCGSVLQAKSGMWKKLIGKTKILLNDCAADDKVLMLCKAVIPLFGDSGRVGYYGDNNASHTNRFFLGGHSLYFKDDFIEEHWIPCLLKPDMASQIDNRCKPAWYHGVQEFLISGFKLFTIIIIIVIYIKFIM